MAKAVMRIKIGAKPFCDMVQLLYPIGFGCQTELFPYFPISPEISPTNLPVYSSSKDYRAFFSISDVAKPMLTPIIPDALFFGSFLKSLMLGVTTMRFNLQATSYTTESANPDNPKSCLICLTSKIEFVWGNCWRGGRASSRRILNLMKRLLRILGFIVE